MNVVVEWVTLLLRIRDVPGPNLDPTPAILKEVFRGIPQSFRDTAETVT
jgi:hypothetical protein